MSQQGRVISAALAYYDSAVWCCIIDRIFIINLTKSDALPAQNPRVTGGRSLPVWQWHQISVSRAVPVHVILLVMILDFIYGINRISNSGFFWFYVMLKLNY